MKTNNTKKIIVSTLSIAMGAALVGSISGSVAWYQYSTRASASMVGVAAGTSRNLQIKEGTNEWTNHLSLGSSDLKPVTALKSASGNPGIEADTLLAAMTFKDKPVYQYANSGRTVTLDDLVTGEYVIQKTFKFRVMDAIDGAAPAAQSGNEVYLQDLSITASADNGSKLDLSNAVRVHVENHAKSEGGTLANVDKTTQGGRLDIGGTQGVLDTDGIKLDDASGSPVFYGGGAWGAYAGAEDAGQTVNTYDDLLALEGIQNDDIVDVKGYYVWNKTTSKWESGNAEGGTPVADLTALNAVNTSEFVGGEKYIVTAEAKKYQFTGAKESAYYKIATEKTAGNYNILVNDSDPYAFEDGLVLTETTDANGTNTDVIVTIWLEGWGLAGAHGASWNYADYANAKVDIDMRFATEAE